jgi:uncharacterized protein YbjT (DUF2867 family)
LNFSSSASHFNTILPIINMSSHHSSKIFVIGGTGAQGLPIIKALVSDKRYSCLVLTRDTTSLRAQSLSSLGNVSFIQGTFASESTLLSGLTQCDGAFINIDGFTTGEKTESYWAFRIYELALSAGIKFFVYGNLDYTLKKGSYDPRFRVGHYDGKGRMGEWILSQNEKNRGKMGAALFTTGPYIEMSISEQTPMTPSIEDGVVTWRVPLGDGAVTHVALEDCGFYVRWLFDHPDRANGMDLEVGIADITYPELAAAFEKVTGRKARYVDTTLEEYWAKGPFSRAKDLPAGNEAEIADPATMRMRENFTGFWNVWKYRILKRDYKLLDEIHPNRIKSAEEWFRRDERIGREIGKGGLWERVQKENLKPILKLVEDRKAKI